MALPDDTGSRDDGLATVDVEAMLAAWQAENALLRGEITALMARRAEL
jgi:hypothetical protein